MKAKANVIHPGTLASIQDNGRSAYAQHGVPKSGFIDKKAALQVNKILGNKPNDAVLEWTQMGPKLKFSHPTQIAINVTSVKANLNGKIIRAKKIIDVPEGSILNIGNNHKLVYSYLAIKGGFQSERVLKSRSMQKGITNSHSLQNMDYLYYKPLKKQTPFFAKPIFELSQTPADTLARSVDCYKGPEYKLLDKEQKYKLDQYFTLSNLRNRMGMQLTEQLPNHLVSMLTAPILPGTVQLTSSGKLIVLGKDCQTTGGYPRILHLTEKGLVKLSQTLQNVRFRFNIIDY